MADILNNASLEADWNGFTNFAQSGDPANGAVCTISRDNTLAKSGVYSGKFTYAANPGGDDGCQVLFDFGAGYDRLWHRFYFKISGTVSTELKFHRNRTTGTAPGSPFGGLFYSNILKWFWDTEALGAGFITIPWASGGTGSPGDGNWHGIEYDYWRNGDPSGFPSAAFWFDGHRIIPNTPSSPNYIDSNGRLQAGERLSSAQLRYVQHCGTLNQNNTNSGQVNFDLISISSTGPIGLFDARGLCNVTDTVKVA